MSYDDGTFNTITRRNNNDNNNNNNDNNNNNNNNNNTSSINNKTCHVTNLYWIVRHQFWKSGFVKYHFITIYHNLTWSSNRLEGLIYESNKSEPIFTEDTAYCKPL